MPDEFANPLTDLRLLVATALREYAPLTAALGPNAANLVQAWDEGIDLRGDMADSELGSRRIQMRPAGVDWNFVAANDTVHFRRRYAIEIYSDDAQAAPVELLEWLIVRAIARLFMRRKPSDGSPIEDPPPLTLLSIHAVSADPDREPVGLDPDKWVSVCDIEATGQVTIAELIADEEVEP